MNVWYWRKISRGTLHTVIVDVVVSIEIYRYVSCGPVTPTTWWICVSDTKTWGNNLVACGQPAGLFYLPPSPSHCADVSTGQCATLAFTLSLVTVHSELEQANDRARGARGRDAEPWRQYPPSQDIGNNLVRCEGNRSVLTPAAQFLWVDVIIGIYTQSSLRVLLLLIALWYCYCCGQLCTYREREF